MSVSIVKWGLERRPGGVLRVILTSAEFSPERLKDNSFSWEGRYRRDLHGIGPVTRVDIVVNSQGGAVVPALGMLAALRSVNRPIRVLIDGSCMSAASMVAFGLGAPVDITPTSKILIHNPRVMRGERHGRVWRWAQAQRRAQYARFMRAVYAKATGASKTQVQAWMDAGTSWSASQAVSDGFCRRVISRAEWEKEPA